jgi:hypothetical protein
VLVRGLPSSKTAELRRRVRVRFKAQARQLRAITGKFKPVNKPV